MRPDRLFVYRDTHREWRWQYRSPNGRVLADSGEGYRERGDAKRQAARVCGRKVKWGAPDPQSGHVAGSLG